MEDVIVARSMKSYAIAAMNAGLFGFVAWFVTRADESGAASSWFWRVIGAAFVIWAVAVIINLFRMTVLRIDQSGIQFYAIFGYTKIRWQDLRWADFDISARGAVFGYRPKGQVKDKLAMLSRKAVTSAEFELARVAVDRHSPGLPKTMPDQTAKVVS